MKIVHSFFLVAVLSLGVSVAVAQDAQKPAPPNPPAPPAPDSATPPPPPPQPGSQNETPPPLPPGHEGRHHGSPRSPEDGRPEGWHRPGWPMPMQAPSKPTPYIGVITSPPPGVLSAQLSLAEGFGLVVSDVLPDSPAAKAGVQRYDVLTKFNDQQLVDSGQFSTLVRALKKGDQANLTLIRKTQEQKVSVTIDERMLPEHRFFPFPGGFPGHMHGDSNKSGDAFPEGGRSYGDRARMYQERMRTAENNEPNGSQGPSADGAPPIPPEDILREVRPGGVAQIRLLRPDGAVTYNMANARLVMKDDTGEIEMTTHDGKRSLVAKNAKGETIFDGAIDTEEQRKALPEDVRKKLDMIEVQRKLAETPQSSFDSALLPDVQ